jgi:AcrR family transcriptional regulator
VATGRTRTPPVGGRPLLDRTVQRTLAKRYEAAAREIGAVLEATYRVIERAGTVDPRMQDILSEAGLSTQGFYRLFTSKDELMLLLLDDGRRRLADYLRHRMAKEHTASGQVTAWIAGTLAQVQNQRAATRTRPFVVQLGRLYEQYPDEQRESMELLLSLLEEAIQHGSDAGEWSNGDAALDAESIYFLTYGLVEHHLRSGSVPALAEVDHVVAFALRGLGQLRTANASM